MQLHNHKWLIYAGIGALTFCLALFLVAVFSGQNEALQKVLVKEKYKQAKEIKAKSDSIQAVVIHKVDSIIQDKVTDSLAYVKEKESLKVVYIKKIKSYEAKIAAIDTMDVGSINSSFSVRKMLSDSSCAVW